MTSAKTILKRAVAVVAIAAPAWAQNGSSFLDADTSTIDYTVATTRPTASAIHWLRFSPAKIRIIEAIANIAAPIVRRTAIPPIFQNGLVSLTLYTVFRVLIMAIIPNDAANNEPTRLNEKKPLPVF